MARCVKINRKDFRELFDTKRPNGDCETVQETMGVFSVRLVDLPQHPLISLVESFG